MYTAAYPGFRQGAKVYLPFLSLPSPSSFSLPSYPSFSSLSFLGFWEQRPRWHSVVHFGDEPVALEFPLSCTVFVRVEGT